MNREEAIRLIGWLKCTTNREDDLEAIDMAIEALKEQPTIPMFKESEEAQKAWTGEEMGTYHYCTNCGEKVGKVTECRPKGEWINREYCQVDEDAYEVATCSNCKSEITIEYPYDNFCPNCGAKMGGDGK